MRPSALVSASIAFMLIGTTAAAKTWYILPDGNGDAPTIQAGIDSATAGDTVLVGCGTYHEHDISMKSGITLRSETGESECAEIDAMQLGRVFACTGVDTFASIQGLRITGGWTSEHGGGIRCQGSSLLIRGNDISGNYAAADGGGIWCIGSAVRIVGNVVSQNESRWGGGIHIYSDPCPIIERNLIHSNTARDEAWGGGGICCSSCLTSNPIFRENVLFQNSAYRGGGMSCDLTIASMDRNTFYRNNASLLGGAMYIPGSNTVSTSNSIFWENEAPTSPELYTEGTLAVICSDLSVPWPGEGNFSADPLFCSPALLDFSLAIGSPCLDTLGCGLVGADSLGCDFPDDRTWLVLPDGSGEVATIQDAVDIAFAGDTIALANGVFTGEGNRDVSFSGKAITVKSLGGIPDSCIIDCGGSSGDPYRGFIFNSGESPESRLIGVKVTDGYANEGGAVYVNGSNPTIEQCKFVANHAVSGGGGVYTASEMTIRDCTFEGNSAEYGGGVCMIYGQAHLERCTLSANSAIHDGGGLHATWFYDGNLAADSTVFEGNSAERGGGAYLASPYVDLAHCIFYGNSVSWLGRGVYLAGHYNTSFRSTLSYCAFYNHAGSIGGSCAVACGPYSRCYLLNCTIAANTCGLNPIPFVQSYLTIDHTIIAFNDEGVRMGSAWSFDETISSTDIFGNSLGDWESWIADWAGWNGNLEVDPLFCGLGENNFSLDSASQCRGMGAFNVGCDVVTEVHPDAEGVASRYSFVSNQPNPFNPSTELKFSIPRGERVALAVLDVRGRVVRTLIDRVCPRGVIVKTWDGRDDHDRPVPSGIYFARLVAGDFTATRKMVLIR